MARILQEYRRGRESCLGRYRGATLDDCPRPRHLLRGHCRQPDDSCAGCAGPDRHEPRRSPRGRGRVRRVPAHPDPARGAFRGERRDRGRDPPARLPDARGRAAIPAQLLRDRRPPLFLRRGARLQPAGRLRRANPAPAQRPAHERQPLRAGLRGRRSSSSTSTSSSASRWCAGPRPRSTAAAPSSRW